MKTARSSSRCSRLAALVAASVTVAATLTAGVGVAAAAPEGSWASTGSLNQPREAHTSNLLANGMVLATGGNNLTTTLASAELYNPITEAWSLTGPMATGRWSHTATLLPNGKLLVAGGFGDFIANSNAQRVLNSAELYDPATGIWSPAGPMATRRALHVATLLQNGKVLVAGGRTCDQAPPATCNFMFTTSTAELYDPATNTWAPTGPLVSSRHTTSAARLLDGRVLVPAGFVASVTSNTADLYDPTATTSSLTGNLNFGRARQGAMLLPDGKVLVSTGTSRHTTAETYDPATGTWTLTGDPIFPGRYNFNQTVMPNGKALVAGGTFAQGFVAVNTRTAEVFDPVTRTYSDAGLMPNNHGSLSALANTRDAVVLSASPTSFVNDPAVCGSNCGKVLVDGNNTNGTADLYTPASGPPAVRVTEAKVACAQNTLGPDTLNCAAIVGEGEPTGSSPTGTVGFFLNAINSTSFIGQCALGAVAPRLSRCTAATSAISAGPHTVWALYFGSSLYSASVGSDDVGNPASGPPEPSDTKVLCNPGFPQPNVPLRCVSLVADDDADVGPGSPTGTVGLFRDAINSPGFIGQCALTPLVAGIASCQAATAQIATGPSTIWALYFGDSTFTASVDADPVTA